MGPMTSWDPTDVFEAKDLIKVVSLASIFFSAVKFFGPPEIDHFAPEHMASELTKTSN